jgi:hypothetical protein
MIHTGKVAYYQLPFFKTAAKTVRNFMTKISADMLVVCLTLHDIVNPNYWYASVNSCQLYTQIILKNNLHLKFDSTNSRADNGSLKLTHDPLDY